MFNLYPLCNLVCLFIVNATKCSSIAAENALKSFGSQQNKNWGQWNDIKVCGQ